MTDIYIVYNNDRLRSQIENSSIMNSLFFHFIDDRTRKGLKEAYKLKSYWGARLTPFAIIMNGESPIKAFYSESNDCTANNIINYINQYESRCNQ